MSMLVNCPNCRTQLQPPPAARYIRCTICLAVTQVDQTYFLSPPPPPYSSAYHHQYHVPVPPVPSPYGQMPAGQPVGVHGKKRALVCGVLYRNTGRELKGSVNDAMCMKFLLRNRFNFPEASILMLTEEENDPDRKPTRENMRRALYWLVQGCQPGDSLVFHFSGHGSQLRNYTGDELDGFDETLCPMDYQTQGMILDDEINETIVRPLPPGVKLHAIVDACHSGTVLDLPFLCRMNRSGHYVWEDHRPRSGVWKGSSGGEVISFSGCDDHQISIDTRALSKVALTGAMTFSFIQAIEHGHATTYGTMLNSMRSTIYNNDLGGNYVTYFPTMHLINDRLKQEPQLTSNIPFDVYMKPFSL
ncbi:hypothetical protein AAG906_010701 [Vitis piasezkii]